MKQIKEHGLIQHYTNNTTTATVINNDKSLNIRKNQFSIRWVGRH